MNKSVTISGVPVKTRTGRLQQPLVQLHLQHSPSSRSPTESMSFLGDKTLCSLSAFRIRVRRASSKNKSTALYQCMRRHIALLVGNHTPTIYSRMGPSRGLRKQTPLRWEHMYVQDFVCRKQNGTYATYSLKIIVNNSPRQLPTAWIVAGSAVRQMVRCH